MTEEGNKGAYSHHHCPSESLEAGRDRATHTTRRGGHGGEEIVKEINLCGMFPCWRDGEGNIFDCISLQILPEPFVCSYFLPLTSFGVTLSQWKPPQNSADTLFAIISVFGSSFSSLNWSTMGSRPLETELTDPRIPPVCYVRHFHRTAIVHHLAPAIEEWASHTHFHCVYDKTYQLIAFWPDIRKRPDKSHWKRVVVCVCVTCVSGPIQWKYRIHSGWRLHCRHFLHESMPVQGSFAMVNLVCVLREAISTE